MSKSTKWMRKGFAWLLCLIMLTGMMSSAASASGPLAPPPEPKPPVQEQPVAMSIYFTQGGDLTKDIVWDDSQVGSAASPKVSASFVVISGDQRNYEVRGTWMEKASNAKEFSIAEISDNPAVFPKKKLNGGQWYSLAFDFQTEDGIALAQHGVSYYLLIEVFDTNGKKVAEKISSTANISYKGRITFDLNYDTPNRTYKTVTFNSGDIVNAPTPNPTRQGYDFTGWYEDPKCTEDTKVDFPQAQYSRKTVYAGWKEQKKQWQVKLHYGDGPNPHSLGYKEKTITVYDGTTLNGFISANSDQEELVNPVCKTSGVTHAFLGWYTDKNYKAGTEFGFDAAITKKLDLYARWGFRVHFDVGNVGADEIPDQTFTGNGGKVTRPKNDPSAEGWTFKGWTLNGKEYDFNTKVNTSFTLVANWEQEVQKQAIGLNSTYELTYNGEVRSVDIVGADGKPVTIPSTAYTLVYNRVAPDENGNPVFEPKDIGWYIVTLSLTDEGREKYELINPLGDGTVKSQLRIYQKPIEVSWSDDSFVYDGDWHCPEATADGLCGNDTCELTVEGAKKNAGNDYTAKVIAISNQNYCFAADYEGQTTTFSIDKRPVTITWGSNTLTYNEEEQTPDVNIDGLLGVNVDGVVYELSGGVVIGSSTAEIKLVGDASDNYQLPDNAKFDFTVSKIQPTLTLKDTESSVQYGDSFVISYTLENGPEEREIIVSSDKTSVAEAVYDEETGKITVTAKGVGSAKITVKVKAAGSFDEASDSFTLKVEQRLLEITWSNTKLEYTGTELYPTVKVEGLLGNDGVTSTLTVDGYAYRKPIEIGEYTAKVVLHGNAKGNYKLPANSSKKYNIIKAPNKITLTEESKTIQYGETYDITYKKDVDTGSVTFESSNKNVASVDANGRITAKYPGTATITVKLGATGHHTGDEVYFTVTVTKRVVTVNWTGDTTYTYDGQGHCPQYELVGLVGDEKLYIEFSGPVKNAGSYEAKVSIKKNSLNSDKYVLDPDTVKKPFKINPVEVKISAKDINMTYGDPSFTLDYSVEGVGKDKVSVILNNYMYQNVVSLEKGKIKILNAGTIEIKFYYPGDPNHTAAEKTIKLEVAKKDVTIKWNKTSFEYDGHSHAPEATIDGLVSGEKINVRVTVDNVFYGNPINVGNYIARAKLVANYPYNVNNYTILEGATCKFEIYKVATKLEVKAGRGAQTEYIIPLYGQKPTFNPKNYKYIVYYNNGDKVEKDFDKDITVSGFSTAEADLGKQTLTAKTTVGDKELTTTFTVTVKKQIWIAWDAQGIVYNGEKQGPKASVKGLTPLEEYITISYDGVNANQGFSTYTAKAEFTAEGGEKYVFSLYNNTCPYRISPKEVTLSWNYDGAAFVYSEEENSTFAAEYFAGSDVLAPVATLSGVVEGQNPLNVKITTLSGRRVEATDVVGGYKITASLNSSNYVFEKNTVRSTNYRIINKVSGADITIDTPKCGQIAEFSKSEILSTLGMITGERVMISLDMIAMSAETLDGVNFVNIADLRTEEGVNVSDIKDVVPVQEGITNWASLGQNNASDKVVVRGILVPYITSTVTDAESFADAINSIEVSSFKVYGEDTYSMILFLTCDGETAFDVDSVKANLTGINESAIRYMAVTKNGVVALIDVKAAEHNWTEYYDIVDPTEGTPGSKKRDCKLGDTVVHTEEVVIPELNATKIKLIKGEGFKDTYFVNDKFDVTGLKYEVTLSNGDETTTETRDVTLDMISGFDSSKEAKGQKITVSYGNLTDSLTIDVVKKEEPKKEDPKKDEPEEPKKDEPKKNQVVIKVGDNAKTIYDVNDPFDATGLTIETVDESGKTITIPVTEQMVSGFDSSKPADIVITISYKGVTEEVAIEVVAYNTDTTFKENGDFYSVTHRTKNDQITFSLHTGVRVDGNSVPDKYISKKSGSLHLLISAEYMKTLPAGEHTLEILFKDGKSTVKFTVAPTPASDTTPVTGDTSSLTMWMILLAAAAAIMVMLRVYAAKRSDAE